MRSPHFHHVRGECWLPTFCDNMSVASAGDRDEEHLPLKTGPICCTDFEYTQHNVTKERRPELVSACLMFIPCISDVLEENKPTICTDCTFLYLVLRDGSYMFRQ
jgi:hypothetical protein